jgi:hypothetical protein
VALLASGKSETRLRERFDTDEMEALEMPIEEGVADFDEFCLPQLKRLKTLYSRAASAGQHVVVVMP